MCAEQNRKCEEREIDAIDGELLPLFLRRMGCSAQVAQLKGEAGMPVFSPQREQAILDKVRARGGEDGDAAAALYSSIMAISRAKQHLLLHGGASLRQLEATAARALPLEGARVVCQGVPGAFSHKAALEFFGDISPWKTPPPGLSPGCMTSSSATGFTLWAPWT